MFKNRARNLVLALALMSAVGSSLLPGAHAASASSIPAAESAGEARWKYEKVQPVPTPGYAINKMEVTVAGHQNVGRKTNYFFQVRAKYGTLQNVTVKLTSAYYNPATHSTVASPVQIVNLGTFSAPDIKDVTVVCNPPPGMYCEYGYVEAQSSNGHFEVNINPADGNP